MPSRPVITLLTDFGEGSRYVAAMKGVILSINPDASIVDISHAVPPQEIAHGARVLDEAVRWFPAGTIHLAVIDPGVGSDREIVCAQFSGGLVVCPNNGLLTNLAAREKSLKLHAVENRDYWLPDVSQTFHGRDIMAPVAAHLSRGVAPDQFGPPRAEVVVLAINEARRTASTETEAASGEEGRVAERIEGEVVEVDSFGNLITNITDAMLADCPRDESVVVRCDEHETIGVYQTYSEQPPMTLLALIGSSGALELAIVDDSAKIMLGVGVGAPVVVKW